MAPCSWLGSTNQALKANCYLCILRLAGWAHALLVSNSHYPPGRVSPKGLFSTGVAPQCDPLSDLKNDLTFHKPPGKAAEA